MTHFFLDNLFYLGFYQLLLALMSTSLSLFFWCTCRCKQWWWRNCWKKREKESMLMLEWSPDVESLPNTDPWLFLFSKKCFYFIFEVDFLLPPFKKIIFTKFCCLYSFFIEESVDDWQLWLSNVLLQEWDEESYW